MLAVSPAAEGHLPDALRIRNGALEVDEPALRPRLAALIDAAVRNEPERPESMPPPLGSGSARAECCTWMLCRCPGT